MATFAVKAVAAATAVQAIGQIQNARFPVTIVRESPFDTSSVPFHLGLLFQLMAVANPHPPAVAVSPLLGRYAVLVQAVRYEPLVEPGAGDRHLRLGCIVGVLHDKVVEDGVLVHLLVRLKHGVIRPTKEATSLYEVVARLCRELPDTKVDELAFDKAGVEV